MQQGSNERIGPNTRCTKDVRSTLLHVRSSEIHDWPLRSCGSQRERRNLGILPAVRY